MAARLRPPSAGVVRSEYSYTVTVSTDMGLAPTS